MKKSTINILWHQGEVAFDLKGELCNSTSNQDEYKLN